MQEAILLTTDFAAAIYELIIATPAFILTVSAIFAFVCAEKITSHFRHTSD